MRRTNTTADALTTGMATIDLGGNLTTEIPVGKRAYTIDQTAGRVIKVWDYLNNREQIIYGDTGTRDVAALLSNSSVEGLVHLRRIGNSVQLTLERVRTLNEASPYVLGSIPPGFRPDKSEWRAVPTTDSTVDVPQAVRQIYVAANGGVGVYAAKPADRYRMTFTYFTSDPWPTSLPGVAVGSIPA